jgi:hypothetical protein
MVNTSQPLDRYSELRFSCSSVQQYKWLEVFHAADSQIMDLTVNWQFNPPLFERIKEKKISTYRPGQYLATDPKGRSVMIAAMEEGKTRLYPQPIRSSQSYYF